MIAAPMPSQSLDLPPAGAGAEAGVGEAGGTDGIGSIILFLKEYLSYSTTQTNPGQKTTAPVLFGAVRKDLFYAWA